ncbi:MAG: HigA family addiction module antidote protein [Spirochaetaceae bacterium]|jgi:addiction module HigA family antidote|nr:HigA family addiction module antidote protein [Spirochaetaceae bacterium]
MAKQSVKIPGVVLKETFLDEYGLSAAKVAEETGLSQSAIRQVLTGKTRISLNVALRLAKYFGNTFQYWLDLQTQYDLAELQKDAAFAEAVKKIPKAKKQAPAKKADPKKAAAGKADAKTAVRKPRVKKTPELGQ